MRQNEVYFLKLTAKDIQTVSGTFLFAGMEAAEVQALLANKPIEVARFEEGEAIYLPDAFRRCLGVILSGTACVHKGQEASSAVLMSVLEKGALFGAATLFASETEEYPTSIHAQHRVKALLIPEEVFREMLQENFSLTQRYLAYLTQRIRFLNHKLEGLICPSAEEKLLVYLLQNADDAGIVRLPFSYTELANSLCMGRASLYRALEGLETQGRIHREKGRKILLLQQL